jgi:hypothetical protein
MLKFNWSILERIAKLFYVMLLLRFKSFAWNSEHQLFNKQQVNGLKVYNSFYLVKGFTEQVPDPTYEGNSFHFFAKADSSRIKDIPCGAKEE